MGVKRSLASPVSSSSAIVSKCAGRLGSPSLSTRRRTRGSDLAGENCSGRKRRRGATPGKKRGATAGLPATAAVNPSAAPAAKNETDDTVLRKGADETPEDGRLEE